jgi:hypothetical protein
MSISEKITAEDNKIQVARSQDVSGILKEIHDLKDHIPSMHGDAKARWVGSIPLVIAEQWSRECGAAIGTHEYAGYIRKKLLDPDYKKLLIKGY